MDYDVTVVGGSVAGLAAALTLARAGKEVCVLEKTDIFGGRQRTRVVDGYTLDEGFQYFSAGFPAAEQLLDVNALDLHTFSPAILARISDERLDVVNNPILDRRRVTGSLAPLIRRGNVNPRTIAGASKWVAPLVNADSYPFPLDMEDDSLAASLESVGITGVTRELITTFFADHTGDARGGASANFVRALIKLWGSSLPALPGRGIAMIPEQLEYQARRAGVTLRTQCPVVRINADGVTPPSVTTDSGETLVSRQVVVATNPHDTTGFVQVRLPALKGLTTFWFACEAKPNAHTGTAVDPRHLGPINTSQIVSNANPLLAPVGHHLIQSTTLYSPHSPVTEQQARVHTAYLWGCGENELELVERDDIEAAIPLITPGHVPSAPHSARGISAAGNWCHSPTVGGALQSGIDAARTIVSAHTR